MRRHLERDLQALRDRLSKVGSEVETAVELAMAALFDGDSELAVRVIDGDRQIDREEIEIEEECLKILALHQPVAADLRYVVAALKVNNDLERAADLAQNIAERALELDDESRSSLPHSLRVMSSKTSSLLENALTALIERDAELALTVIEGDQQVDELHRDMYKIVAERILEQPASRLDALRVLSVSRYLERISDLATNIAEDVVFQVEGRVIRHQGSQSLAETN
jgi:phosphate transport system protein